MAKQKSHKLLVIDDSELIRSAVAMVLERHGYEVKSAANLTEFDSLLASWWPDVIITDVQMPDISGDELCRSLKGRILVQVLLFSNLPDARLAELAKSAGADGYVSKLEGFDVLPEKVRELIDAASEPEDESRAPAEDGTKPAEVRHRIALLDSSELGREVTGTVLDREGFDVRISDSVEDFRALLRDWQPDLVLLTPKSAANQLDQLCTQLRSDMDATGIPIVFFSDEDEARVRKQVAASGADYGLSKLQGYGTLISKLRELCTA